VLSQLDSGALDNDAAMKEIERQAYNILNLSETIRHRVMK
jgi:hypothetical protein